MAFDALPRDNAEAEYLGRRLMTRIRLKYVNEYRTGTAKFVAISDDRALRAPLPGLPGSIEFMAAYQAALAIVAPPPPSPRHVIAGSLAAVAGGYLRSADFANLSPSSQASYQLALKPVLAAHGHRLVRDLPKMAARHVIEEIGAARPGMANLTRQCCPRSWPMRSKPASGLTILLLA